MLAQHENEMQVNMLIPWVTQLSKETVWTALLGIYFQRQHWLIAWPALAGSIDLHGSNLKSCNLVCSHMA